MGVVGTAAPSLAAPSLAAPSLASRPWLDEPTPSPAPEHERGWRWLPPLLLAVHVVLAWLGRAPGILTRQDGPRYFELARSLRAGQYRDAIWVGAPAHHMYPPGYPALLALWMTLGGERFDWLVVLQILLSVAALSLTYAAARRSLEPGIATAALAALVVNPALLEWAGQIASEGALALCFAAALWGATCLTRGPRQVALLIGAAILAPYMRTAGVVLPAAVVALWLLQRRYRDALLAAALCALCVGPLLWWTMHDPIGVAGSSYAADMVAVIGRGGVHAPAHDRATMLLELMRRLRSNAAYYPTQGLPWVMPSPTLAGTLVDNVLSSTLLTAALLAGVVVTWRRYRLATLLLVGSAALFLAWPYHDSRYLVPLLPLIVPTVLVGFAGIGARVGVGRALLAAATVVIAGTGAVRSTAVVWHFRTCERGRPMPTGTCLGTDDASFFRAVIYVRDSLPAAARVVSAKSEPLAIYSGHLTVPFALLADRDSASFGDILRRDGAEYVLLGSLDVSERARLARRLLERCRDLQLVASFPPRTYLFRLPPTAGVKSGDACEALAHYYGSSAPP